MFTLAFAGIETDSNVFYGLTLVILILTIIQTLIFYRCPHCGRLLYTRSAPPSYCPHCGEELLPPDRQDRHPDW